MGILQDAFRHGMGTSENIFARASGSGGLFNPAIRKVAKPVLSRNYSAGMPMLSKPAYGRGLSGAYARMGSVGSKRMKQALRTPPGAFSGLDANYYNSLSKATRRGRRRAIGIGVGGGGAVIESYNNRRSSGKDGMVNMSSAPSPSDLGGSSLPLEF